MLDVVKIEISQATYDKLMLVSSVNPSLGITEFGGSDEYIDYLINMLIKDHEEISKYVKKYVEGTDGKCICKTILGRPVIANHSFVNNACEKCGIPTPITVDHVDDETVITFGTDKSPYDNMM